MSEREVVCILGMHRSGTSLVARILNLLGLDLGPEHRLFAPNPDNPKGFWEHAAFVDLNEEILRRFGGSWDSPPAFPPEWARSPTVADLRGRVDALVREDFAGAARWGWKDPRACMTLPFWQTLFPRMRYVLCLRDPLSVAGSLRVRDTFDPAKSGRLWLTHVTSALAHTAERPRTFVFYEDLLVDWREAVPRLADFVGLEAASAGPSVMERIGEFVAAELQHHRSALSEIVSQPDLPFPAKAVYLLLRAHLAGRREDSPGGAEVERTLASFGAVAQAVQTESDQLREDVAAMRGMQAELVRLSQELQAVQTESDQLREAVAAMRGMQAELVRLSQELQATWAHAARLEDALTRLRRHPVWRAYMALRSILLPPGSRREGWYQSLRHRREPSRGASP